MSMTHEKLRQWDREIVWHAFTQMAEYEPFIIERADGCTLTDIDGKQYLDGVSSLWCNVHGHRHPKLDAAVRGQLDRMAHVTLLGASHPPAIQLAKRLTELAPAGLQHVFYSDDGATAVEVAVKMAFQYWQQRHDPRPSKTQFVAFNMAYHGDTIGCVSLGGMAQFHAMFQPLLFSPLRLPVPDTYRLPPGVSSETACQFYLDALQRTLSAHHHEVAAVVMEPLMQAAAGMMTHPAGFLRGVRELTRDYDVLLIADEVAVGMGRTGTLFACEREDVQPDLVCLAKGLTGGYLPLAATLTTNEIWQAFLGPYAEAKAFFHGHTYGGNPLGAAVAIASLDLFEEEQTLVQAVPKIARMREHLQRLKSHPHVGDVRQCGMMAGIELVRDQGTGEPFAWQEKRGQRVCAHTIQEGVWLRPLGNVVVLVPPLAISIEQLDRICEAVERGIEVATR